MVEFGDDMHVNQYIHACGPRRYPLLDRFVDVKGEACVDFIPWPDRTWLNGTS